MQIGFIVIVHNGCSVCIKRLIHESSVKLPHVGDVNHPVSANC